jgi:hypothetical protein
MKDEPGGGLAPTEGRCHNRLSTRDVQNEGDGMACEAEQARVDELQAEISAKIVTMSPGRCAGICGGNLYPGDCAACHAVVDDLRSRLTRAQEDLRRCRLHS